jgi:HEAT repeat protein
VNAELLLSAALALVALGVLLLGVAIVARRALRVRLDRRRDARCAPHRLNVMRLVAGERDEAAAAVRALGQVDDRDWRALRPGIEALLGKVRGESHAQVVELLHRRGSLEAALKATRSFDPVRRARAAHLIGTARQRSARGVLEHLLTDRDPDVRRVAAAALGHLGDPRSTAPLLHTLAERRSVPPSVVASAVAELGHWAHASLFSAIGDESPMVRAVAVEICGLAGGAPSAPVLRAALRHDSELEVRVRAARALGRLGVPGAVPDLVSASRPSEPAALRMVAARALGDIGSVDAVPGLRVMLDAPEHRVAANAAAALARLGGTGVSALREVAATAGRSASEARAGLALAELTSGEKLASADATQVAAHVVTHGALHRGAPGGPPDVVVMPR